MNTEHLTISELCALWLDAKKAETTANVNRIAIEEAITTLIKPKEEGAETHKVDDFKITITGVINRTLDQKVWELVKDQIPAEVCPVKMKPELITAGVKWLKENQPEHYATLAKAMTVKPGKTGVKVERIED